MHPYHKHWPQFYTATTLEWKPLLKSDKYKNIIVKSLQYLVREKRIILYGFVIMSNHLHIIWRAIQDETPATIQFSFMKFTAQQIKFDLQLNYPDILADYKVDTKDRMYQFWERNSLAIDLYTPAVFQQKIDYIHYNPVKAGLCNLPEEYPYSSAGFYETDVDKFSMLTHYNV
jgi:putative transposase